MRPGTGAGDATAGEPVAAWPTLREELRLSEGPADAWGAPTWTIHDPVRNRYFRVGWAAFEFLSRWHLADGETLLRSVRAETTCDAHPADLDNLLLFLRSNSLLDEAPERAVQTHLERSRATKLRWQSSLLHNYLFFRIPLLRPDPWLRRALPYVEPLFGRTARRVVLASALIGLYLVGRQWSEFTTTLLHFFDLRGLVCFAAAQVGVKVLHELGHAFAAARRGCRVPSMGVAFMVLYPVLYTDTSDCWRLRSRRERLEVDAAGVFVELSVAALATVAWALLPDGTLRSVAFVLATSSWVLSLLVNLNPCMRFDGYYLLCDWLGVENLQARGFAWGRWQLRRTLFAIDEAPPHIDPPARRRVLVAYAFATWVYRFFLFLGIALLVYHFFIKVVGIALFAVEITWFLLKPIAGELHAWWQRRAAIAEAGRLRALGIGAASLAALACIPWSHDVRVPALFEAETSASLYAPEPARIARVAVRRGQEVVAGQLLLQLESPALEAELAMAEIEAEAIDVRWLRRAAKASDRAALLVLGEERSRVRTRITGLEKRRQRLALHAPFDGQVGDLGVQVHAGRWVGARERLVHLLDPERARVRAFAGGELVGRVSPGQWARFVPDEGSRPTLEVRVAEVAEAEAQHLDAPLLASDLGGPIAVRRDPRSGARIPAAAVFPLRFETLAVESAGSASMPRAPDLVVRGQVHVDAARASFAARIVRRAAALLIRESGF